MNSLERARVLHTALRVMRARRRALIVRIRNEERARGPVLCVCCRRTYASEDTSTRQHTQRRQRRRQRPKVRAPTRACEFYGYGTVSRTSGRQRYAEDAVLERDDSDDVCAQQVGEPTDDVLALASTATVEMTPSEVALWSQYIAYGSSP